MIQRWLLVGAAILISFTSCSKDQQDPQVFLPSIVGSDGTNLDARRAEICKPAEVELRENFLTQRNFQLIFACANYDKSLNDLAPLFQSEKFPQLISSVNLILKSKNTQGLKETLKDWFEGGEDGQNRLDRLLPIVAKVVKNPSFQDFLPVLDTILQSGKSVWNDLLPGLADIIYNERFEETLGDAIDALQSFGPRKHSDESDKDYATGIRQFANFLRADIDGKTASLYTLELLHDIENIQLGDANFYEYFHKMLGRGGISLYFLNSSASRGEVVDPKLNESPDSADVACAGLNETPEQRQECAYRRLFKRTKGGGDAPIVQLAGMIAELNQDHAEMIPSLAAWFADNGPRVSNALGKYVIRAKMLDAISSGARSELNIGKFLTGFARSNNINTETMVRAPELKEFLKQAFSSSAFAEWAVSSVTALNVVAYGEKNAQFLEGSSLAASVVALYNSPDILNFSSEIIPNEPVIDPVPEKNTLPLKTAITRFNSRHRQEGLQVDFGGKRQEVEKHLGDLWVEVVKEKLGEDVVMDYVIQTAQTLFTKLANEFRDKNQTLAEWYYSSAYGDPGTTEMIVGYATGELDILGMYYRNKEWLLTEFTEEAFTNDDDKRAFRTLVEQVPNMILYVRSGMARSGADLTRAMNVGEDKYLVKNYLKMLTEGVRTGWIRKGARLIEAYHRNVSKGVRERSPLSSDIKDEDAFKQGVEAIERIVRSLVEPERDGDYSTTTLSRVMVPLSSIVSDQRRAETERFLLTSADEVLKLSDKEINDFFRDLNVEKPDGSKAERIETYRSVAEMLRNPNLPAVVSHLSALFQEKAVKPALDFFAHKIEDGSLPRVFVFIRRVLGFGG